MDKFTIFLDTGYNLCPWIILGYWIQSLSLDIGLVVNSILGYWTMLLSLDIGYCHCSLDIGYSLSVFGYWIQSLSLDIGNCHSVLGYCIQSLCPVLRYCTLSLCSLVTGYCFSVSGYWIQSLCFWILSTVSLSLDTGHCLCPWIMDTLAVLGY